MNFIKQYRNGVFQGENDSLKREGYGIFIDDHNTFILSNWKNDIIDQETLVIIKKQLIIYGNWVEGRMSGVNVISYGKYIIIANYKEGEIFERFIIINEQLKLLYLTKFTNHRLIILHRINFKDNYNFMNIGEFINLSELNQQFNCNNLKIYFEKALMNTKSIKLINYHDQVYIGFTQNQKCHGLGLLFKKPFTLISMGKFYKNFLLNGRGIIFDKIGQKQGIYVDNKLINYYSSKDSLIKKRQDHLKSMKFINDVIYFKEIHYLKQNIEILTDYIQNYEQQIKIGLKKSNYIIQQQNSIEAMQSERSDMKYSSKYQDIIPIVINNNQGNQKDDQLQREQYIPQKNKIMQKRKPGYIRVNSSQKLKLQHTIKKNKNNSPIKIYENLNDIKYKTNDSNATKKSKSPVKKKLQSPKAYEKISLKNPKFYIPKSPQKKLKNNKINEVYESNKKK